MDTSEQKGPAPGMIAVAAGFVCAIAAAIFIRDYSTSWPVRLAVPTLAAIIGIVVAFKVCEMRNREGD